MEPTYIDVEEGQCKKPDQVTARDDSDWAIFLITICKLNTSFIISSHENSGLNI